MLYDPNVDAWQADLQDHQMLESTTDLSDVSASECNNVMNSIDSSFYSSGDSISMHNYDHQGQFYTQQPEQFWAGESGIHDPSNLSGIHQGTLYESSDSGCLHFGSSGTSVTLSDSVHTYDKSDFTEAADGMLYKSTSDYTSGKNGYKPA
jgi:hypothetical protein